MGLFDQILGGDKQERSLRLAGIGDVLMDMDVGRSADVSPYIDAIQQRQKQGQMQAALQDPSMLERFSDEERKYLASMPVEVAAPLIQERLFAKADPWANMKVVGDKVISAGANGLQVMGDFGAPETRKGVVVGGRLVDPTTGQVIYEGGPDQGALTDGAPSGFMWAEPNDRTQGVVPIQGYEPPPADNYERYVREETAAGRQPLTRLDYDKAKSPKFSVETRPDGSTRIVQGVGDDANPERVSDIGAMNYDTILEEIDAIGSHPDLNRVLGPIEGGGGNNVDDLNWGQRVWYGEGGLDAIDRIGQLQGKTWMTARDMLKGGGQITDYESKKAEQAMARLSRAKGEAEFRTALRDVRDAITEGRRKLIAAGKLPTPAASGSASLQPSQQAAPSPQDQGARRRSWTPDGGLK